MPNSDPEDIIPWAVEDESGIQVLRHGNGRTCVKICLYSCCILRISDSAFYWGLDHIGGGDSVRRAIEQLVRNKLANEAGSGNDKDSQFRYSRMAEAAVPIRSRLKKSRGWNE
jgi:hypothetical protein